MAGNGGKHGQGDLIDGNAGDRSAPVLLCPGGQGRGQQGQAADGHQLALIGQPLGRELLEPGQQGKSGGDGDGLKQGLGWRFHIPIGQHPEMERVEAGPHQRRHQKERRDKGRAETVAIEKESCNHQAQASQRAHHQSSSPCVGSGLMVPLTDDEKQQAQIQEGPTETQGDQVGRVNKAQPGSRDDKDRRVEWAFAVVIGFPPPL